MEDLKDAGDAMSKSYYIIRSRFSNQVLDFEGGSKNPGAKVVTWLTKNWSDQLWYDDPQTVSIRSKTTGFCLDMEDEKIVVNPCDIGSSSQRWKRDGSFIRNARNPDLVIAPCRSNVSCGAKVTAQLAEQSGPDQQFDFTSVPGLEEPYEKRLFFIASEMNSKVLDVYRERTAAGTNVIIWPRKDNPTKSRNQLWYFDRQGVIRSALNDFVIETKLGTPAKIMPSENRPSQSWTLVDRGLISKMGECLEISENKTHDGANVFSSKFYDTVNQQWRLEFV